VLPGANGGLPILHQVQFIASVVAGRLVIIGCTLPVSGRRAEDCRWEAVRCRVGSLGAPFRRFAQVRRSCILFFAGLYVACICEPDFYRVDAIQPLTRYCRARRAGEAFLKACDSRRRGFARNGAACSESLR